MRNVALLSWSALLFACSTGDGGHALPSTRSTDAPLADARARLDAVVGSGILRAPPRTQGAAASLVVTRLANADVRLAVGEGTWAEIAATDVHGTRAWVAPASAVIVGAAPDVDVVEIDGDDAYEEVRILRSASASTHARYRLRVGPGVASARLREGHVELLDAVGRVVLATAPMTAVDAARRDLAVRVALEKQGDDWQLDTDVVVDAAARFPVYVDPLWSTAASMSTARVDFTATLLSTGKVLAAGGADSAGNGLASAELYDPATNTWSTTGSMSVGRAWHAAVALPSGRALVVGGNSKSTTYASAEIYDVATGKFTVTGSLGTARTEHTLTLLATGDALAVGGYGSA